MRGIQATIRPAGNVRAKCNRRDGLMISDPLAIVIATGAFAGLSTLANVYLKRAAARDAAKIRAEDKATREEERKELAARLDAQDRIMKETGDHVGKIEHSVNSATTALVTEVKGLKEANATLVEVAKVAVAAPAVGHLTAEELTVLAEYRAKAAKS